jgi:hypothetical protein
MKANLVAQTRHLVARAAAGALIASVALIGTARADTDGIAKLGQVTVPAISMNCGTSFTPTSFSFDISWIDPFVRAYLLADRTHGGASNGDVLMIDLSTSTHAVTALTPPASDPFAGIRCDANANFGGTTAAGRNEITGPNGVFTVNHVEAWVGDGPSPFALAGQTNTAADYVNDKCDSSVRVFNIITGQQTDHINVGGCFRTDEGAFDPEDQVALFANPSDQPLSGNANAKALNNAGFITLISTVPVGPGDHHKILKQINFDGTHGTVKADLGIEQAVYSHKTGMFYIAIPGTSTNPNGYVAVVDPRGDADDIRVVTNFALSGNCAPNGAALGPDDELYLGCSAAAQQVMDIRSGHLIKSLTGTAGGCDEVAFNAGDDHFVGACTDTNTAPPADNLDISDADPAMLDAQINTGAPGAHSITADPVTVTDWMPMFQGACGTGTACVAIYGSSGGDDKSVFAQERAEDRHHDDH